MKSITEETVAFWSHFRKEEAVGLRRVEKYNEILLHCGAKKKRSENAHNK